MNKGIRVPKIRLIDAEGGQVGVVDRRDAQQMADEAGLDLVMVADGGDVPVCRIMDYGKHKYQQSKTKGKQSRDRSKEIKIRPGTEDADFHVKLNKLIKFLDSGCKVKVTMRFRGREMAHQDLGLDQMKRLLAELDDHGVVDREPRLEGRQMIMLLSPKKKN